MGIVTTIDSTRSPPSAGNGHSHRSDSLRLNAVGTIGPNSYFTNHRINKLRAAEDARNQVAALAELVRIIEPKGAEGLACRMIKEFGSLGQIFSAATSRISQFTGSDRIAATIDASRVAVLEALREEVCRSPVNPCDPNFLRYLAAQLHGEDDEHLHAIYLDGHQRFIRSERVASGNWHQVNVRLRPLIRRAIDLHSAKIILFHNHPSGDVRPSEQDIHFTKQAIAIAAALEIEVLDHIVVAGRSMFSMRKAGYL